MPSGEFHDREMRGSRFRHVDLSEAVLRGVDLTRADLVSGDLTDARFRDALLHRTRFIGVFVDGAEVTGEIVSLMVNGVDVAPLVEAELDRRDPERPAMRPTDPDGCRRAWAIIERRWGETVAQARTLDPALLHERVDGEWSFIETLRNLVFATETWLHRAVLGDPEPWHVWTSQTTPVEGVGWPEPRAYPVRECLRTVLNEEWEHRMYAMRDLTRLTR
jgi:hypothetical protein